MGRTEPGFLVVGHLDKPHGIKGEFYISLLTDHPEGTFAPGVVVHLGDEQGRAPDPETPPLKITAARPFKTGFLVSFDGVDTRNAAEAIRGRYLLRELEQLEPLAEGEVFYHQLLGMRVETVDGQLLGEVVEVYELSPSDMLDVRWEDKEYMIPFREGVIVDVDIEARRVVVDPPAGLLDLWCASTSSPSSRTSSPDPWGCPSPSGRPRPAWCAIGSWTCGTSPTTSTAPWTICPTAGVPAW
jgi:16S rRNA processing protein RimM